MTLHCALAILRTAERGATSEGRYAALWLCCVPLSEERPPNDATLRSSYPAYR